MKRQCHFSVVINDFILHFTYLGGGAYAPPPTLPTGLLLLFPIAILSIICMRPTVTVVACGLYVCVFVGNEHELCKNA